MTSDQADRAMELVVQVAQVNALTVARYQKLLRNLVKREPGIADRHADLMTRLGNIDDVAHASLIDLDEQMEALVG